MSPAEAIAPGSLFRAEIVEQPAALERLLAANDGDRAHRRDRGRAATSELVRMVGHGSSDNAASYGVYAFGLLPRWTAMRDSITLTVHYDTPLDLSGSMVIGLSQSGQTPDVVEYLVRARRSGRLHGRDHERPRLRPRRLPPRRRSRSSAGPELAVAATKTYVNTLGALALLAGHIAGRGAAIADGIRGAAQLLAESLPAFERGDALARAPVRLHRPHVRDRARHRVRDGAGDRAEAARDLPDRGRAADRDRPRARAGRRARSALPRLGDRLARRDACHGAGGGRCASTRWARRSSRAARPRPRSRSARTGCPVPPTEPALLSPLLSVVPGQLFAWRSPAPAASTRTRRTGLNKITLVT